MVRLLRESLCGILLENGEEDLAVLVARSDLPDVLDPERDGPALAALGLSHEDLRALLPTITGDLEPDDATGKGTQEASLMTRTISDRWADLVTTWTGGTPGPAAPLEASVPGPASFSTSGRDGLRDGSRR
jgi:hypothetical protein